MFSFGIFIKALLTDGAGVDPMICKATTPLMEAAANGHMEILEVGYLVGKLVKIESRGNRFCGIVLCMYQHIEISMA